MLPSIVVYYRYGDGGVTGGLREGVTVPRRGHDGVGADRAGVDDPRVGGHDREDGAAARGACGAEHPNLDGVFSRGRTKHKAEKWCQHVDQTNAWRGVVGGRRGVRIDNKCTIIYVFFQVPSDPR